MPNAEVQQQLIGFFFSETGTRQQKNNDEHVKYKDEESNDRHYNMFNSFF